jgi:hypothetical protein
MSDDDDDGGSTHLWNVGRQSFYTAVCPRRQLWTSCLPIYIFILRPYFIQNKHVPSTYSLFPTRRHRIHPPVWEPLKYTDISGVLTASIIGAVIVLVMQAVHTSEMSFLLKTTPRHIPEGCDLLTVTAVCYKCLFLCRFMNIFLKSSIGMCLFLKYILYCSWVLFEKVGSE